MIGRNRRLLEKSPILPEEIFDPIEILRNLVYLAKCDASDRAKVLRYMAMAELTLEKLTLAGKKIPFTSTSRTEKE